MNALLVLLYVVFGYFLLAMTVGRLVRRYYRFPIPSFLTQVIDNPLRRRFLQDPEVIADRMMLEPGMTVVEVGPGKGSYTFAVARRVAPGTVYACDISDYVFERLRERVEREGIDNVEPRIDDAYNFSFMDDSVDRVFMIACLPEIPDPVRALRECFRVLRPGGLLCLCELFFDPDYPLRRIEKRWAGEAGFVLEKEFGGFLVYQLNFRKPI
ncbi:MAG: methyltransferase domain-containing protein [Candidatus Bathyarchaeota archaeon]|nr:methyltransferase domain-containing protein [Candidatus Bathyarchaeota archaeon]